MNVLLELYGVLLDPDRMRRDLRGNFVGTTRYPDARTALERLRKAGHKIYVAAWSGDEDEAALVRAGIREMIDGVFRGDSEVAPRATAGDWTEILEALKILPEDCVLVDEHLRDLEAAATARIAAILIDRKGIHPPESLPPFLQAVLRNLAGLPHYLDTVGRRGSLSSGVGPP